MFGDILDRNKAFLDYKNGQLKNSENWHFSKGVCPLFWFKKIEIFPSFSLGKIGSKKVLSDILDRDKGDWKRKLKKSKNWDFPKGLDHGFGQKLAIFRLFILGKISQENVFHDILEKKAFLEYKNKKLKKSEN